MSQWLRVQIDQAKSQFERNSDSEKMIIMQTLYPTLVFGSEAQHATSASDGAAKPKAKSRSTRTTQASRS